MMRPFVSAMSQDLFVIIALLNPRSLSCPLVDACVFFGKDHARENAL